MKHGGLRAKELVLHYKGSPEWCGVSFCQSLHEQENEKDKIRKCQHTVIGAFIFGILNTEVKY